MEQIRIARLALARKHPYFAPAAWAMRLVVTDRVHTMAVDEGWRLYANPEYTARLAPQECVGVLWHEMEHLLRRHFTRGKALGVEADKSLYKVWNVATDCAINDGAAEAGFQLPAGVLYPEQFGLELGGLEEAYYWALLEQQIGVAGAGSQDQTGQPSGSSSGMSDTHASQGQEDSQPSGSSSGGMSDTHASPEERKAWELPADDPTHPAMGEVDGNIIRREVARQVIEHQQSRGSVPAGILRWAEGEYNPTVPWQRLLAHQVRQGVRPVMGRTHSSYERLHRRHGAYAPAGIWLAGSYDLKPRVAVVMDTSGSMTDRMLGQAAAEVGGLLRRVQAEVFVLAVDAAAAQAQRVSQARQIRLYGGGGTDMGVGIEAALKLRPRVDLIVVLTDGITPWPRQPPSIPVVAGIIGGDTAGYPVPSWIRRVDIPH
jgi:predicted metal-dependent peptidase